MDKIYDVIVIGGGPAGYTAGLYAVRAGLKTVLIEKMCAGGQMTQTMQIDNYPGFEEGVEGYTLGAKMQSQAERFGLEIKNLEVISVSFDDETKSVETDEDTFYGKTIIAATGAKHRHLGLDRENEMLGRGVGYCAACDGMLYRGKTVAVVGGGNSALSDVILLSKICERVILIHRRDTFRAAKVNVKALEGIENVEFCMDSQVLMVQGEERLTGIKVKNLKDSSEKDIACDGLFISIGRAPETDIFKGKLELDENNYIVAGEDTKTSVSGVFAVGDVRTKTVRQIVTAVADGAVAVHYAEEYI